MYILACSPGYYGTGLVCTACPAGTFGPEWDTSFTTEDSCMDCYEGFSTSGADGQVYCAG